MIHHKIFILRSA